jgi:hypothetical protein
MRHIAISGRHVGRHKVADMFWLAASQCAKAPNRVLRDYRAQASHDHCESVTSSAAPHPALISPGYRIFSDESWT